MTGNDHKLDKKTSDKGSFIIPECEAAFKMNMPEVYHCLVRYGGFEFLTKHYRDVMRVRKQAEEWTEKIGDRNNTQSVVTEFELFENAFTSLNYKVLRFEGYCSKCLDSIVLNRNPNNENSVHDYGIDEEKATDKFSSSQTFIQCVRRFFQTL